MDKCYPARCPNLPPTPVFGIKDCSLRSGHTPVRGPSCSEKGVHDSLVGLLSLAGRAVCLGRTLV